MTTDWTATCPACGATLSADGRCTVCDLVDWRWVALALLALVAGLVVLG